MVVDRQEWRKQFYSVINYSQIQLGLLATTNQRMAFHDSAVLHS